MRHVIIDGTQIAEEIIEKLKRCTKPEKFIGVVSIQKNGASEKFIEQKKRIAELLEIDFRVYTFSELISTDQLKKNIEDIAKEKNCGGIIVQLPLPEHLNREQILNLIPKEKDVDVLSRSAYEQFLNNQEVCPPSVSTFCEILSRYQRLENVSCKTFAVVGNGFLVGKPISDYLKLKRKQIIILDKGEDLSSIENADVIILGTGVPNIVNRTMIKDGALVVDFGCSFIDGKLCGDLEQLKIENLPAGRQGCKLKISYTPTPGGTGPILVAKLFENFYTLNKKSP